MPSSVVAVSSAQIPRKDRRDELNVFLGTERRRGMCANMGEQGQMAAKENPKLRWEWTPEKEHCSSCEKLQGKVKRHSQWEAAGLYPQAPVLECMAGAGGVTVCGCRFVPTDEPMSKGPLPRI